MDNLSRYSMLHNFASSKDGRSLSKNIHAKARHHASGHVTKLDPNWHSIRISFGNEYEPQNKLLSQTPMNEGGCRIEFDYRPWRVILVGPKVGNMLITERIFEIIPEPLVALMRINDVFKPWDHVLCNPKHVIELIDGKTVIRYEDCWDGVVRNVKGDTFDVESITDEVDCKDHLTRESLMAGFKVDGLCGQPVDVSYFPLLLTDGTTVDIDELLENRRLTREKWKANALLLESKNGDTSFSEVNAETGI